MTIRPKRERLAPEARRAQLIALGVEMLATRTLEQLSVEALAAEAGISRGLLFHYFTSKQDFYVAVVREVCDEMLRRTEPEDTVDSFAGLRRSLAAFVDYVLENPEGYIVLVRGAGTSDPAIRAVIDETRSEMASRVESGLSGLGVEVTPQTRVLLHGWFAFAEECTVRWLSSREFSREELLDMLEATVPAIVASMAGKLAEPRA